MTIGILTFHNGFNHGAYLQAYALQNFLKRAGYNNLIINYKNLKYTLNEYNAFITKRRPLLTARNIAKMWKFKQCQKKFDMTKRIYTKKSLSKIAFNTVVIGSDSVWNYTDHLIGFDTAYFSDSINAKRIISYAASFGPDTCGDEHPKWLGEMLTHLEVAGVRDSNTKKYYEVLTGKPAQLVLDPTFIYDFYNERIYPRDRNYILVYTTGLMPEQIEEVKNLGRRTGKKIISIGYRCQWCDKNIIAVSPFEWLGYFEKADFIVTTMYHGMLFSVKFNKPFCSFVTPYRLNKIGDFLERIGLSDRMLMPGRKGRPFYDPAINYEKVNIILNNEIESSKEFLLKNLNGS